MTASRAAGLPQGFEMTTNTDLRALAEVAEAFEAAPQVAEQAARLAMNDAARWGRTQGSKAIRRQVNLTARYVNDNLRVTKFAQGTDLEVRIGANPRAVLMTRYGARMRTEPATSDPRWLKGDPARGIPRGQKAAGARGIKVKRGGSVKTLYYVFWVRLLGTGRWEPAERTGPGRSDYRVLHSTSVDQVWRDVREDITPEIMQRAAAEFTRQFARLS